MQLNWIKVAANLYLVMHDHCRHIVLHSTLSHTPTDITTTGKKSLVPTCPLPLLPRHTVRIWQRAVSLSEGRRNVPVTAELLFLSVCLYHLLSHSSSFHSCSLHLTSSCSSPILSQVHPSSILLSVPHLAPFHTYILKSRDSSCLRWSRWNIELCQKFQTIRNYYMSKMEMLQILSIGIKPYWSQNAYRNMPYLYDCHLSLLVHDLSHFSWV